MESKQPRMSRKLVVAGLSAGLLAGGAAGAILGTSGISGAASSQDEATTTVAPEDPGSSEPEQSKLSSRLAETLTPLVEDGTITQEQMLKVIEAIEAARAEHPRGDRGGKGHGQRGGMKGQGLDAAAEALGMDSETLRERLRAGSTIAEIAEEQGVEVQAVIDALVAEAKAHLDEKVASGDLTQEEADERLAEITERITDKVNDGAPDEGGESEED